MSRPTPDQDNYRWGDDNAKLPGILARMAPERPKPHPRWRKAWAALCRILRISDGDDTLSERED